MRPALVWGCTRYPSRSRATISDRTVAEETCTPGALATWDEPTGSALPMYSVTTASRMAAWRSFRARASSSAAVGRTCLSLMVIWRAWHSSLPSARPFPPDTPVAASPDPRVGPAPHPGGGVRTPRWSGSVVQPQGRDEGLLGHLHPPDVL